MIKTGGFILNIMYKNINLTLLLLFLVSLSSIAQSSAWTPSELGDFIWDGNFGISHAPLKYSNSTWQNQTIEGQGGGGIMVDFNGTYMLSTKYGIAFGLGVSSYNSEYSLGAYSDEITGLTDSDNMTYNLITDAGVIEEEHSLVAVDIPVKFQMYIPIGSRIEFVGAAGLKLNIPVSASYELQKLTLTTKAFYPDLNFMLSDYEPMGLYNSKRDLQQSGDLNSKVNASILLEAGIAIPIGYQFDLSFKAYFSHGLNNAVEGDPQTYLVVENGEYNGLQSFLGDAKLMQVGFKLGLIFHKME